MKGVRVKELLPIYSVVFLGFLGYALTITLFIPMLMDSHFDLLPFGSSIGLRTTLSGILLAMYPLGQFLGSPMIGKISDAWGRKKVLLISLTGCFIGFGLVALSINMRAPILLFLSAFLTGLFESNMAVAQSVIADYTHDPVEKVKLMGYAYSMASLSFIVGPFLAFTVPQLGYSAPFWMTAMGILGLFYWVSFGFKEHDHPKKQISINVVEAFAAFSSIVKHPRLYKIYLINFLTFFAVQGLYRVSPLYVMNTWNPSVQSYALLIAFVSFMCLIANFTLLGSLARRFATHKLLAGLLVVAGIVTLFMVIPTHYYALWPIYGLAALPTVMTLPTAATWLSQHVHADEQGQALGNNQALMVLGEASSAFVGGFMAAIAVPLPIIVMGSLLLITGLFLHYGINAKTRRIKQGHLMMSEN